MSKLNDAVVTCTMQLVSMIISPSLLNTGIVLSSELGNTCSHPMLGDIMQHWMAYVSGF